MSCLPPIIVQVVRLKGEWSMGSYQTSYAVAFDSAIFDEGLVVILNN